VRKGFELLHQHLSHSTKHEVTAGLEEVFPSGEKDAQPLLKSVIGVLPCGAKNIAGTISANDFINSKSVFLSFKPLPLPRTAVARTAGHFYLPNAVNSDLAVPSAAQFTLAGTMSCSPTGTNSGGTVHRILRSRGVYSHINISYQGPLQTATGSLYMYIPQDGAIRLADPNDSTLSFTNIFGESDGFNSLSTSVINTGIGYEKGKKSIITLAKLAELGSISIVVYNERDEDYIFRKGDDIPQDILNENPTYFATSLTDVVNFAMWCDSTTLADRIRVVVTQHYDVVYNTSATFNETFHHGHRPQYVPPNHVNMIPEIVNSTQFVIPHHEAGTQMRAAHALQTVRDMAQGQAMDIGTLSTEEEMDVGHPSFGSVKKAVKAAWNTEQIDNEYYGAAVAGQPEVAAYAAPVVEPAIAAHAVYNFFRTNK